MQKRSETTPFILCVLFVLVMGLYGCHARRPVDIPKKPFSLGIKRLAMMGFEPAMGEGERAELIRSPISGTVFHAESVPTSVARGLTDLLFEMLASEKRYELVSPGQVQGSLALVVGSDPHVRKTPLEMIQAVGKRLDVDAVLAGHVYRWREREGADYGVHRPASVAFDVSLVRPEDGAILWRWKYDKTQKSFFENALDLSTFVKSRGRWLKVKDLAMIGCQNMIKALPKEQREVEKSDRDDYSGY